MLIMTKINFLWPSKKLLLSLLEYKKCFFKISKKDMEEEEKKDIKFWCFQCLMASNNVSAFSLLQPFLNFNNKMLMVRKIRIQMPVEIKPMYTWGSSIGHPLCRIDLNDSVDFVSGKKSAKALRKGCMASIGQIIPHSKINGKKEPNAR